MSKKWLVKLIAFTLSIIFLVGCSQETSQEEITTWPNDNITIITPFSEGGSIDRMARGLAAHWEKNIDYNMIVENYGGAGGILGTDTFLNRPDDGSTIYVGGQPTLSMGIVTQDPDHSLDDFVFVNMEQIDYSDIVVRADSPYETTTDLIEAIRNNPGKLSLGTTGGSGVHLFALAFVDTFELDVREVIFDGGGEARTALLGGHIDFMVMSAFGDMSMGDDIRVLAVSSEKTFPGWPDAEPINDVLKAHNIDATIPPVGDNRFIAVHKTFVENHPEAFDALVESYKTTFESEEYQSFLEGNNATIISQYTGPEKAREISDVLHEVTSQYREVLMGN